VDIQPQNQTRPVTYSNLGTHSTDISAAEIASLWNTIVQYRMLGLIFEYFAEKAQDPDYKSLLSETRDVCKTRVVIASDMFNEAKIPLPIAFDESDVNMNAPSLFTDAFYLRYLFNMIRVGMNINVLSLAMSARKDIRDFYDQCITSTTKLNIKVHDLMLERGNFVRSPYVNVQNKPDIITEPSFLTGFLGEKRPLTTFEIAHLFFNSTINYLGQVLLTGFAQVAKTKEVMNYFEKGARLAAGYVTAFSSVLHSENLPVTLPWDIGTTSSTVPPFSEKLMTYHVVVLNATAIGNYGVSVSTSLRHDLTAMYGKIIGEIAQYSGEGSRLMMDKGWLEEPPKKTKPEAPAKDTH
jgi:hypothetical protein